MGVTTAYDLGEHGLCYITVPPGFDPDAPNVPVILYAHGSGGAANQWATLSAWAGMRAWCDANGWVVVEGTGGGKPPSHSDGFSWGNESAPPAYLAYLAHAELLYDVGVRVLLGRSMGGLPTSYLYSQSERAGDFDGWINNSGVSTLLVGTNGGGTSKTAWSFAEHVFPAFGYPYDSGRTNYAAVEAAIQAADMAPEAWPAADWAGKKILCCYGDADTTVRWATMGGGAMLDTWAAGGADVTVRLRPGGDHSGSNGSYQQVDDMAEFLAQFTGSTPEPPARTYTRVKARFIKLSDGVHRIHTVPV
jgi:hypothetical protein